MCIVSDFWLLWWSAFDAASQIYICDLSSWCGVGVIETGIVENLSASTCVLASQTYERDLSSWCGLVAVDIGIDENLIPKLVYLPTMSANVIRAAE